MYGALHHFIQGRVNEAVACEWGEAVELFGHDSDRVVAAAVAGAYVTHMQMRVVLHLDFARGQRLDKTGADQ